MSRPSADLAEAVREFLAKLYAYQCSDLRLSNKLCPDVALNGRPWAMGGISAPCATVWSLSYALAVKDVIQGALELNHLGSGPAGLSKRTAGVLARKQGQVATMLGGHWLPSGGEQTEVLAWIKREMWLAAGLEQAHPGEVPDGVRIAELVGDLFRAATATVHLAQSSCKPLPEPTKQATLTSEAADGRAQSDEPPNGIAGLDRFRWAGKEVKRLSLAQFRLLQVLTNGHQLREPVAEAAVIGHVYETDNARLISNKRRAFGEVRRRVQDKIDSARIGLVIDWVNKALELVPIPPPSHQSV